MQFSANLFNFFIIPNCCFKSAITWYNMNIPLYTKEWFILKKPVYFITRHHKSNYQNLLKLIGNPKNDSLAAAAYILGAVGTIENSTDSAAEIEKGWENGSFNWDVLLSNITNEVDQALIKLAANLVDNRSATIREVFSPLNDEYQAVSYQALLMVFPSFSKTWDRRFEFADQH